MTFTAEIEVTRLIRAWTKNAYHEGDARLLMDLMNTIVEREARKIGLEEEPLVTLDRAVWDSRLLQLYNLIYERYGWKIKERLEDNGITRIACEAEVGDVELPPAKRKRRE